MFPRIAIGTHGMDYKTLRPVVMAALENGIRGFDTARQYGNESVVGAVLRDSLKSSGIDRSEIFVTTKLWYTRELENLDDSLRCLGLDYVDLCLLHYPYPDWYIKAYWRLIDACKGGKALKIGVSNFRMRHLEVLLSQRPEIVPHCTQFERHPLRQVPDFVAYCKKHNIAMQAQSPLCVMDSRIKTSKVLLSIAQLHEKTISQVVLRWHLQCGLCPVVRSKNPERVKENASIFDFCLTQEEVSAINSLDINYKYLLESLYCPGF